MTALAGELEIYTKPFDKQRRNAAAPRPAPRRATTCGKVSSQAWAPNDAHRSTLSKLQTTSQDGGGVRRRNRERRGRETVELRTLHVVVVVVRAKEHQKEAASGKRQAAGGR